MMFHRAIPVCKHLTKGIRSVHGDVTPRTATLIAKDGADSLATVLDQVTGSMQTFLKKEIDLRTDSLEGIFNEEMRKSHSEQLAKYAFDYAYLSNLKELTDAHRKSVRSLQKADDDCVKLEKKAYPKGLILSFVSILRHMNLPLADDFADQLQKEIWKTEIFEGDKCSTQEFTEAVFANMAVN